MCRLLGHPEWPADPRFGSNAARLLHRDACNALIETEMVQEPAKHWLDLFWAAGVAAGPIATLDQVFRDPQVLERDMLLQCEHPTCGTIPMVGFPVKLSATPHSLRRHPPRLGEHTREVLAELRCAPDVVSEWESRGIVASLPAAELPSAAHMNESKGQE